MFSSLILISVLFLFIFQLIFILKYNIYLYLDLGRFLFLLDILDTNLVFIVDTLSLLSGILVIFLTIFAQYFGVEYMYREAFITRLVYLLNLFATSVVFLFFVYDFFLILIVWELIGLFSLLLVNFYSVRIYTLKAALKTFIFSRLSDLFIFIVFLFLILLFSTTDLSVLFLQIPFFVFYNIYLFNFGFNVLNVMAVFLVFSSAIKAAQFLFHVWLPDAMEAPTPASALIHSSTLVIMGIYLIIRFQILFEFSLIANFLMSLIGALTIALGAVSASFQNDIKKLVAYSTISQMGYLFCGCGFLCYNEVIFYLIIHALNKAFLFILVGYIVHFFNGNTDLRYMGALYFYALDFVFILIFISLNLTGLPYTSGFLTKELLLFQTFRDDFLVLFIRALWFISFFFTPFYMIYLNIAVMYYFKLNTVNLYLKNYIYSFKFLYCKNYFFLNLNYSLVISRLTIFILFLFFIIVLYFGEMFLTLLLNYSSTTSFILKANWSYIDFNLINFLYLTPSTLLFYINYLIILILLSSLRYLFLIRNYNLI